MGAPNLKEMAHYHAAVRHLWQIFEPTETDWTKFWSEFECQYALAITQARVEFGAGMGRNKQYETLGKKGKSSFRKLKKWVMNNYPWPEKKASSSD